jgi:cystathionine gamma-synthase/methionine-gamma-lyase
MVNHTRHKLATRAAHAGTRGERPDFTPTVAPIHPSVSFMHDDMAELDGVFAGDRRGYVYGRYGNPTVAALEQAVAALEGGDAAVAFASGMAAIHACLLAAGARAGSAVVAAQDVYGGTYALLDQVLRTQGVRVEFVDIERLESVRSACADLDPVVLLAETVSNPLLKVADLPALAGIAHSCGASLLVDSTFTTPFLCRPIDHGADFVIHSATKYLGGHGDVLGGTVVGSDEACAGMREVLKVTGANLGPQEAWLATRGLRTLALRVQRQCENAFELARWLEKRPEVSRVLYPGLPSHPQHDLATHLFEGRGFGGMISFELAGAGQADVFRFFEALRLCLPATTLGDVCTLVLYPAHSSHRALGQEERDRIGIGAGLVRMSVGIEAIEDLKEDLAQALSYL